MKIVKNIFSTLAVILASLFIGNSGYGQETYTNYCPDTGFDIKLALTIAYFDSSETTFLEKQLKSVSEIFENEELQQYSWAVDFERVKNRPECFRIGFGKDFQYRRNERKARLIKLKYYSGKAFLDEVTVIYDVVKKQSSSHIKNGSHKF